MMPPHHDDQMLQGSPLAWYIWVCIALPVEGLVSRSPVNGWRCPPLRVGDSELDAVCMTIMMKPLRPMTWEWCEWAGLPAYVVSDDSDSDPETSR